MVVEKLIQLQGKLTDRQFADLLGIHRVSWVRIKNGKVPVSDKFLVRVNRVFPHLEIFLSKDVQEGKNNVPSATPTISCSFRISTASISLKISPEGI